MKLKYTGLGKSGYGQVLKRKPGEFLPSFVARQEAEFDKGVPVHQGQHPVPVHPKVQVKKFKRKRQRRDRNPFAFSSSWMR